jgi:prepilin-type N-terminal cleavage/methylation domain-containing protein
MRRGFTLLELALVLSITGVILGIALPRLATIYDSLTVQRAAQEIVSAHQRARIIAIMRSQSTLLTVAPDRLTIRLRGATDTLWQSTGPEALGVSLRGLPRTMTFSPVGITMGLSNATFQLTRGAATRTVVVSRLGRVRIVHQ